MENASDAASEKLSERGRRPGIQMEGGDAEREARDRAAL